MNDLPIGIFDSGVGGLSVAKQIIESLPSENIIYLGDTARVPYGNRDKATITSFAKELTNFLLKEKVKALVVACNTMSAVSLSEIQEIAGNIPVIDVINPTISLALNTTHANVLGLIGTRATVNSGAYDARVKKENEAMSVFSIACPLFVSLVEEGLLSDPATTLIAEKYLSGFLDKKVDTIILGCTHFALLKSVISKIVGESINLIDPAIPTTAKLLDVLKEKNLLNSSANPYRKFYVTDAPDRVYEIASLFFNGNFSGTLEKVSLG